MAFLPATLSFTAKMIEKERAQYKLQLQLRAENTEQKITIESQTSKVQKMESMLIAAREMIKVVMSEGQALLSPYEIKFAEIEFGTSKITLGEGSFGTVFKATLRGELLVAVKTMRVSKVTEGELTKFKSEIIVSPHLSQPRICTTKLSSSALLTHTHTVVSQEVS